MQVRPLAKLVICLLLSIGTSALAETATGTITLRSTIPDRIQLIDSGPVTISLTELTDESDPDRWVEANGSHTLQYQHGRALDRLHVRAHATDLPEGLHLRAAPVPESSWDSGKSVSLSKDPQTLITSLYIIFLSPSTRTADVEFSAWASSPFETTTVTVVYTLSN